jgi:phage-related protein
MTPIDTERILEAIADASKKLGDRLADTEAALAERIDALAESTGRNFDRVDAALHRLDEKVENLATEVGAARFDVAAHRMETRAAFKRQDERIIALEERPA